MGDGPLPPFLSYHAAQIFTDSLFAQYKSQISCPSCGTRNVLVRDQNGTKRSRVYRRYKHVCRLATGGSQVVTIGCGNLLLNCLIPIFEGYLYRNELNSRPASVAMQATARRLIGLSLLACQRFKLEGSRFDFEAFEDRIASRVAHDAQLKAALDAGLLLDDSRFRTDVTQSPFPEVQAVDRRDYRLCPAGMNTHPDRPLIEDQLPTMLPRTDFDSLSCGTPFSGTHVVEEEAAVSPHASWLANSSNLPLVQMNCQNSTSNEETFDRSVNPDRGLSVAHGRRKRYRQVTRQGPKLQSGTRSVRRGTNLLLSKSFPFDLEIAGSWRSQEQQRSQGSSAAAVLPLPTDTLGVQVVINFSAAPSSRSQHLQGILPAAVSPQIYLSEAHPPIPLNLSLSSTVPSRDAAANSSTLNNLSGTSFQSASFCPQARPCSVSPANSTIERRRPEAFAPLRVFYLNVQGLTLSKWDLLFHAFQRSQASATQGSAILILAETNTSSLELMEKLKGQAFSWIKALSTPSLSDKTGSHAPQRHRGGGLLVAAPPKMITTIHRITPYCCTFSVAPCSTSKSWLIHAVYLPPSMGRFEDWSLFKAFFTPSDCQAPDLLLGDINVRFSTGLAEPSGSIGPINRMEAVKECMLRLGIERLLPDVEIASEAAVVSQVDHAFVRPCRSFKARLQFKKAVIPTDHPIMKVTFRAG